MCEDEREAEREQWVEKNGCDMNEARRKQRVWKRDKWGEREKSDAAVGAYKGRSSCELEKREKCERGKENKVGGGGRALQKGTMMIHYFLGFCKLFLKSCLVCLWLSYPLSYKVGNPKSSFYYYLFIYISPPSHFHNHHYH